MRPAAHQERLSLHPRTDRAESCSRARGKSAPHLDLMQVVADSLRFRFNQLLYGAIFQIFHRTKSSLVQQCRFVMEARVVTRHGAGQLPFCVTRDEHGIWRGGQPAWMYLRDLASSDNEATVAITRQLLAQLPANVSFHFVFSPELMNAKTTRAAFKSAGFRLWDVDTYVCVRHPPGSDLVNTFTGKSIKGTLRRATRDLELFEISAEDFFAFHEHNLEDAGKDNYRDTAADRLMLEEGLRRGRARILAARRKQPQGNAGTSPIDAAVACLWDGADGAYKLWRMSHRASETSDTVTKPHPDASKLLILAVMEDATSRNLTLETDGSTPGLAKFYAIFGPGVFRRTTRLQCEHETVRSMISRYYPSIFRRPNPARASLSGHNRG